MNISAKELSNKFPEFETALIEEMVRVGTVRDIKSGETIIQSGQNIRYALLILEGLIKIYREDDSGNEFFMYHLEAGQACALSLVCATKQETSEIKAQAVSDTSILSIPLSEVDKWMGKYKGWGQFALGSYRQRFEELLQTIDHIAFQNMDQRLVFYLKRHREKLKSDILPLPFTEIAQELNSSREVISRLMKKLSEKGLIRLHRTHIEILDLDKIQA